MSARQQLHAAILNIHVQQGHPRCHLQGGRGGGGEAGGGDVMTHNAGGLHSLGHWGKLSRVLAATQHTSHCSLLVNSSRTCCTVLPNRCCAHPLATHRTRSKQQWRRQASFVTHTPAVWSNSLGGSMRCLDARAHWLPPACGVTGTQHTAQHKVQHTRCWTCHSLRPKHDFSTRCCLVPNVCHHNATHLTVHTTLTQHPPW